jgi:hypothetical protein
MANATTRLEWTGEHRSIGCDPHGNIYQRFVITSGSPTERHYLRTVLVTYPPQQARTFIERIISQLSQLDEAAKAADKNSV